MVTTTKDTEGRITAYIEWSLRDKLGLEDKEGKYVWVNDMWVHPNYRFKGMFRKFQRLIEPLVPTARFIYWRRKKHKRNGKSRISIYNERQLFKLRSV